MSEALPVLGCRTRAAPSTAPAARRSSGRRCPGFLGRQRWFAARRAPSVRWRVADGGPLLPPLTAFRRSRIEYEDGASDRYALPLLREPRRRGALVVARPAAAIAWIDRPAAACSWTRSPTTTPAAACWRLAAGPSADSRAPHGGRPRDGRAGRLPADEALATARSRTGAEQSNSSVIFGTRDPEALPPARRGRAPRAGARALPRAAGFDDVPAVLASIEYAAHGESYALAVLHALVRTALDRWEHAKAESASSTHAGFSADVRGRDALPRRPACTRRSASRDAVLAWSARNSRPPTRSASRPATCISRSRAPPRSSPVPRAPDDVGCHARRGRRAHPCQSPFAHLGPRARRCLAARLRGTSCSAGSPICRAGRRVCCDHHSRHVARAVIRTITSASCSGRTRATRCSTSRATRCDHSRPTGKTLAAVRRGWDAGLVQLRRLVGLFAWARFARAMRPRPRTMGHRVGGGGGSAFLGASRRHHGRLVPSRPTFPSPSALQALMLDQALSSWIKLTDRPGWLLVPVEGSVCGSFEGVGFSAWGVRRRASRVGRRRWRGRLTRSLA